MAKNSSDLHKTAADTGGAADHEFGMIKSKGMNHGFEHVHIKHAQSSLNTEWLSDINNSLSGSPSV
jgi:hypothetical protein